MTTETTKNRWSQCGAVLLAAGLSLCWATGMQASDDALLQKLVDKGILNQQEADQLKKDMAKEDATTYDKFNKLKVANWINQMNLYGDFRLRADYLSNEKDLEKSDRLRWRYRLRLGTEAKLQDWADVGVRLISGETSPGTQLSGNASMTGTFTKKPINIDMAYARIHPPTLEWLQVIGGKFEPITWSPTLNSPMIYDPDLTVEGLGEQLNFKFGDKKEYRVFANAQQMVLHEFSTLDRDAYMFDSQAGFQANLDPVTITVAGGYYLTEDLTANDTKGAVALGDSANVGNDTGKFPNNKGSSHTTNTTYLADFGVVYGAAEVAWTIRKDPFLGTPAVLKAGGLYMKNIESAWKDSSHGDATTAWTGQGTFGDNKKKGQWMVAYQYKRMEANASFDAIADDDFGAGTDRKGHVIKASYNIKDWWQLGFTAFITEKISSLSDRPNSGHNQVGIPGQDQVRIFADTVFKF